MSPLATSRLRRSHVVDRLVAAAITVGGSSVLLAVALLMVFLVAQCLPLFRGGSATPSAAAASGTEPVAAVEDEYREQVVVLGTDGTLRVVPRHGPLRTMALEGVTAPIRTARTDGTGSLTALQDGAGLLQVWSFRGEVRWRGGTRVIEPSFRRVFAKPVEGEIRLLAVAGDGETARVLVGNADGATLITGGGEEAKPIRLRLDAPPTAGAVSGDGREVWLASARQLAWFSPGGDLADEVTPKATVPLSSIPTAVALVLGDVTCLVGDESGAIGAWQVLTGAVVGSHVLDRAGSFHAGGAVRAIAISQRDKAFAVLSVGRAEVAYLTGRRTLLQVPGFPADATFLGISPRRDGLFAVASGGVVHRWSLDIPHSEATLGTLFLPVRYEGYSKPELAWQSTGGSESYEPKLSLVPLLVGTLKGALYALLFSAPCGLAAALYVSQFASPRLRIAAKPLVELMAALPSVVVGFLAALVLAPLLQRHLVGTLSALILLPVAVVLAALAWGTLPLSWRRRTTAGRELLLVSSVVALALTASFAGERLISGALFGGDFAGWLLSAAGIPYDQRNAVVVGFALGFAVIPIIFTLAEDAFSNVPASLISASLALGATRWQAARTVAIPAASPGLFAAVMTGFGRAVGETMIVLMATGNTPILSLSPFNGMRTMSACIAVELPEAPYGGTLYRVLILTALLLFLMTFVINTLAVMVADRLRRRFGRLAA